MSTPNQPISLPLFRPPYSLKHSTTELRPVKSPTMASKCSSKRKSHTFVTLNQKLEMIKLNEEGMLEGERDQKLGLLYQTVKL